MSKQRTNVVYITTKCNLRCEYCYESDNKNEENFKDKDCTYDDLDNFLNEIMEREEGCVSTIVIMGGEPLICPNKVFYLLDRCKELGKTGKHRFGITITTNGTLITNDIINKFKQYSELDGVSFGVEISYDGSGQYRRKFPNGKSSLDKVENIISKLIKNEIYPKISYTVNISNYDKAIKDTIYIIEKFNNKIDGISYSIAYMDLENIENRYGFKWKNEYKSYFKYIYNKYNIPLCDMVCDLCKKCDKLDFEGNSYLSPITGITYATKEDMGQFSQFQEEK